MRAFIVSFAVFALILTLSVINGIYVTSFCGKLLRLEEAYPDKEDGESPSCDEIERTEELLDKHYVFLCIIGNGKTANQLLSAFHHMRSTYYHGSRADYLSAKVAFVEAVKTLERSESIGIRGIII